MTRESSWAGSTFRAARRAGGDRRVASVGELRQLVRYLREVGVMALEEGVGFRNSVRSLTDALGWLLDNFPLP